MIPIVTLPRVEVRYKAHREGPWWVAGWGESAAQGRTPEALDRNLAYVVAMELLGVAERSDEPFQGVAIVTDLDVYEFRPAAGLA